MNLAYAGEPINAPEIQIDGVVYSLRSLLNMSAWDREALGVTEVPPPPKSAEQVCFEVDAERDRRLALDFPYDFAATPALNDAGDQIEAGVRLLQMSPVDRSNWQTLQGAALTAVISGAPETILPMRAEDNWNIQTPALQVLQVLAAMTQHGSALLFAAGAIKSAVRAAEDPSSIDINAGWPQARP